MGGQIFVGIRTASGAEHLGLTWTNWLDGFFLREELYEDEGGAPLRALTDYWDARASNGWNERLTRIKNAVYGVVLLDIPSREIWEHNPYFTPTRYLMSPSSNNYDTILLACDYLEQGRHAKAVLWPLEGKRGECAPRDATRDELKTLIAMNRASAGSKGQRNVIYESTLEGPRYPGMLEVHMPWAKLVHTDNSYLRSPKDWDDMRAWLKKRKWASPVNATPRVR